MAYLIGVIGSLFVLTLCVAIHEWGHMRVARFFHVGIVEYSIGMGPAIWWRRKNETVYSIRLLPFGGYCVMCGEQSMEAGDKDHDEQHRRKIDYKTDWPEDKVLTEKPWWQRALIYMAGPGMNFVLGFIACVFLVTVFHTAATPVVHEVMEDHPAAESLLQPGDVISGINGRDILTWADYVEYSDTHSSDMTDSYILTVTRGGEELTVKARTSDEDDLFGIVVQSVPVDIGLHNVGLYSGNMARYMFRTVADSFYMLATGQAHMTDMSGVIGVTDVIADSVSEAAEDSDDTAEAVYSVAYVLCYMMALLSVNLGFFNLIPFPVLDGGRLFLCLVEGVIRRRIPRQLEYGLNVVGTLCLFALVAFVLWNDILRLI